MSDATSESGNSSCSCRPRTAQQKGRGVRPDRSYCEDCHQPMYCEAHGSNYPDKVCMPNACPAHRPTAEQLHHLLLDQPVQTREVWKHRKTLHDYRVVAVALAESDHRPMVVYRSANGSGPIWLRPVVEWAERFVRIQDAKGRLDANT